MPIELIEKVINRKTKKWQVTLQKLFRELISIEFKALVIIDLFFVRLSAKHLSNKNFLLHYMTIDEFASFRYYTMKACTREVYPVSDIDV